MGFRDVFMTAMTSLWSKIATYLPNLAAGIVILIAGYVVARLAGRLAAKLLVKLGVDRASNAVGIENMLRATGVQIATSEIIGRTVYLFTLLLFVITAAETLGLEAVSGTIDSFILYLPKVVAAIVIGLAGLYVAQLLRDAIRGTTAGMGSDYANALAGFAYVAIIVVVATIAIGQLDIDTGLVHLIIGIVISIAGFAAALALGLGTRSVAANIVYGIYAREDLKSGISITTRGVAGEIVDVGSVTTVIRLKNGNELYVPNSEIMSNQFEIKR